MISLKKKATTPTGSIWTFHNTIRVVPANIHLNDPKAKGWWLGADRASNQATLEFFANEDRSFDTLKEVKEWIAKNFADISAGTHEAHPARTANSDFDLKAWASQPANAEQLADIAFGV
tara:strand:- start:907 stop:1263 length:357 start_codon:yes stop_codon:yes gene_type:complete